MIKFALRGLFARKLRTVLTALGIVLGVALVCGTYVLTDSISSAFNTIFKGTYRNTDVAVTGKAAFSGQDSNGNSTRPPSFDAALLDKVRALPDVAALSGSVAGAVSLIGRDGQPIVFGGAPNLGFSVDPEQPQFNQLSLASGSWPITGQVVIDRTTADKKNFAVGQTIRVEGTGALQAMRISGIVKFGHVSSIGGATLAGFDLATAQQLLDKRGKLDEILITARPGVSPAQLVAEVRGILPNDTQVRTGAAQATKDAADTNGFVSFLQSFLLAFGGIALFVGSFVIANSLSITIAQRSREFATLRTLGASRRQVLGSVIVEALVTGASASLVGLLVGLGLATLLFKIFDLAGLTLPNDGLVLQARTIIVSLVIGTLITLGASLRPAIRATRVPPIAAVREGATLPPGRLHRYRGLGAALVAVLGFGSLAAGLFTHGLGTPVTLTLLLGGAVFVFIGLALFASRLVRPLARVFNPLARWSVIAFSTLVWPLFTFPFWLLRSAAWGNASLGRRIGFALLGTVLNPVLAVAVAAMTVRRRLTSWRPEWPAEPPGVLTEPAMTRLGGQNSQRDPQRTAATSAALMIGLTLVTLVAALAAGIIRPFEDAVDSIFVADYAITPQGNAGGVPITVGRAAATAPGVESIASVRGGQARAFGDIIDITAVDPTAAHVLTLNWTAGSSAVFARLGASGAFVDDGYASTHHLAVGSAFALTTPNGRKVDLHLTGVFKPPTGGSPFGPITISTTAFDRNYDQPQNLYTLINMRGGVTAANTATLKTAIARFPSAKAVTRAQFKADQTGPLTSILNVLYVLLALSVIVSIFGIVNTLVLTVFERTRELGMMRAIGMTRRQTRRLIRHESVVTALIGAALGIVLGLVLAGLLSARLDFIAFVVPGTQVVTFAITAVLVGIFAAVFPARRAARLDPLDALHYE